jgi:ABC-type phosphate transport system substrate-binding protein
MRTTILGRTAVALLLVGLAVLAMPRTVLPQAARTADVAVVVNPSTPVEELSFAEMRRIFRGERQYWTKDVPVVLLVRAPVALEREVVLKTIYQMTESEFKQYWIAKIFRAEATSAPKLVYSNDSTNQLVSAIPGAIAFMQARDVRPGLKVLRIDKVLPGEQGYPLRAATP